jgi:hypothetical protein
LDILTIILLFAAGPELRKDERLGGDESMQE